MSVRVLLPLALLAGLALSGCALVEGDPDKPGIFDDQDADNDGFNYEEDCDDENAAINSGEEERCDSLDLDEDCNGVADNADEDAKGGILVFHDADNDGYGEDGTEIPACEATEGYTAIDGDCDDTDPRIHPGAVEICDGGNDDEDCNGVAEDDDPGVEIADQEGAYADVDGDGFGDARTYGLFCDAPDDWVADSSDCDDGSDWIHPGAAEVCDGMDDDCDGLSDESDAVDAGVWYADQDDDGFGDAAAVRSACDAPYGFVADDSDCDDSSLDVYFSAPTRVRRRLPRAPRGPRP